MKNRLKVVTYKSLLNSCFWHAMTLYVFILYFRVHLAGSRQKYVLRVLIKHWFTDIFFCAYAQGILIKKRVQPTRYNMSVRKGGVNNFLMIFFYVYMLYTRMMKFTTSQQCYLLLISVLILNCVNTFYHCYN